MLRHKGLLVILDGLGDRPSAVLNGQTPLEAAETPHLDRLAAGGLCGFVHALIPWVPVSTQTGTGLLMGLAREDLKRVTRGPIEAAGVGFPLRPGDVALRCNFATLQYRDGVHAIFDRRAGRITEGTHDLAAAVSGLDLGDGITAQVRAATQHRAVLVLSGPDLSDAITNTDPGAGRKQEGVLRSEPRTTDDPAAARTAEAVNRFVAESYRILCDHQVNRNREAEGRTTANGLITRDAGTVVSLRNLVAYLGLRTALVTGESTLVGLGRLFGFDVLHDPAFTADHHTDLDAKVRTAQEALRDHDLVFLHVKGTDTTSHDMQPRLKQAFIERIDSALAPLLTGDLVIGVTGDHSTGSTVGTHTGDPVPACLAAPHSRRDAVQTFGETACRHGGLGALSATSFLCAVLDHMGALHNFRAHEYPFYW